jgi:hypothetical protein
MPKNIGITSFKMVEKETSLWPMIISMLIGAPFLLSGLFLCTTCIGAIFGIPLIFGTMMMMTPYLRKDAIYAGPCPYCGNYVENGMRAFDCKHCKERIMVANNKMYTKTAFIDRDDFISE